MYQISSPPLDTKPMKNKTTTPNNKETIGEILGMSVVILITITVLTQTVFPFLNWVSSFTIVKKTPQVQYESKSEGDSGWYTAHPEPYFRGKDSLLKD